MYFFALRISFGSPWISGAHCILSISPKKILKSLIEWRWFPIHNVNRDEHVRVAKSSNFILYQKVIREPIEMIS